MRVGITRAGNVIGGGDWAEDRIVPDCIRAWSRRETVDIRSPEATRPWQHVLEPGNGNEGADERVELVAYGRFFFAVFNIETGYQ